MILELDYKNYIADVKNLMFKSLSYDSIHVRNIVSNIPLSNGKMVRALILFCIAKMLKNLTLEEKNKCVNFATSIELLHIATLIHDDVIDESVKRRGEKSLNSVCKNRLAILAGDVVFSTSFRLMTSQDNSEDLMRIVSHACEDLVCGEIEEEILIANKDVTKVEYLSVIDKKTARLFEAAAKIGASISSSILVELAGQFGKNIGIAFQIIDDGIDYFSTEGESGKPQFSDIKSKKITIPLILLREKCEVEEFNFIEEFFSTKEIVDLDIAKVLNLMKKYDIKNKIYDEAKKYIDIAKNAIFNFKESKDKQIILKLLDDLTYRKS